METSARPLPSVPAAPGHMLPFHASSVPQVSEETEPGPFPPRDGFEQSREGLLARIPLDPAGRPAPARGGPSAPGLRLSRPAFPPKRWGRCQLVWWFHLAVGTRPDFPAEPAPAPGADKHLCLQTNRAEEVSSARPPPGCYRGRPRRCSEVLPKPPGNRGLNAPGHLPQLGPAHCLPQTAPVVSRGGRTAGVAGGEAGNPRPDRREVSRPSPNPG